MKIIILIPIYNDWQSVKKLLEKINHEVKGMDHSFSITLVNDASTEQFTENFSNLSNLNSIQVINLKNNVGHARCIATGLKYINENQQFDYIIPMDGDGEDRPEEIKLFVENFNYHPNKTIVGERVKRSENILFKICYFFHKILTYTFTGQSIKFGNYTCLTKSTIEKMLSDKATWSSFSGSLAKNCNDKATISSVRGKRYFGPSKMSFLNLIKHSLAIIGVFKFSVLVRSILFVLVYMFLIYQKISFIMILPIIFIGIFLISTFIISQRGSLEEMNNSLSNILIIDKII
tara:strand:- start:848 stop:1717 length:870 start_codon:yes stop_codon:yes gene_type:complete